MQNRNVVNWFEIPTKNLARAQRFYEAIFKITLKEVRSSQPGMKMVIFPGSADSAGATGALIHSKHTTPSNEGTVVYFRCHSLGDELACIQAYKDEQDGIQAAILMPKTAIGKDGFVAHFSDTEGNRVGLHSMQ